MTNGVLFTFDKCSCLVFLQIFSTIRAQDHLYFYSTCMNGIPQERPTESDPSHVLGPKPTAKESLSALSRRLKRAFSTDVRDLISSSGKHQRPSDEPEQSLQREERPNPFPDGLTFEDCFQLFDYDADFTLHSSDQRERFFEDLHESLRRVRDYIFEQQRHDSPIASFGYHVLTRTSLISHFLERSRTLDEFLLSCIKLTIPSGTQVPHLIADCQARSQKFQEWHDVLSMLKGMGDMSAILEVIERVLNVFFADVYEPPERAKYMPIRHSVDHPNVHRYIHLELHRSLHDDFTSGKRSAYRLTEFFPPAETNFARNVQETLDEVMPRGFDTTELYYTPLFLQRLWQHLNEKGNLLTCTVGDAFATLTPHRPGMHKRYLGVNCAMSMVRAPEGFYDPALNCLKNVLLWAPFYSQHEYDSPGERSTSHDFVHGQWNDPAELYDGSEVGINEYQLIALVHRLADVARSPELNLEQILQTLFPDIHPQYFVRLKEGDSTPALDRRLSSLLAAVEALFQDQPMRNFFKSFVVSLRRHPLNEWEEPKYAEGRSVRDIIRLLAEACFRQDEDALRRQLRYQEIYEDQVSRWEILNHPAATYDPQVSEDWHRLCRRFEGLRMLHRDIDLQFLCDVFAAEGIDFVNFVENSSPEDLLAVLTELKSSEESSLPLVLLMYSIRERFQVIQIPHWRRKKT